MSQTSDCAPESAPTQHAAPNTHSLPELVQLVPAYSPRYRYATISQTAGRIAHETAVKVEQLEHLEQIERVESGDAWIPTRHVESP